MHAASGTPGTKEAETQGPFVLLFGDVAALASSKESELEQQVSKKSSKLREIKPSYGPRSEHYFLTMFGHSKPYLNTSESQQHLGETPII